MRARLRRPAPTIRLRLTLTYGIVFLVMGAVLLTIGYVLVRHNLDAGPDFVGVRRALQGRANFFPVPPGFQPGSQFRVVADAVRSQYAQDTLHRLLVEYVLALVVMGAISVAAGWILAGRALAPLREITATARRVSGQNLGERIDLVGPADELKELADTFDEMLGRLDRAFAAQRRFVASASHELRTPLAIMRTEVDVALADEDASVGELRGMGEAVRETIDRSEGLIESLLMLARSDTLSGHSETLDLAQLAADCITDLRARADVAGSTSWPSSHPHGSTGTSAAGANDRQPDRQRDPT